MALPIALDDVGVGLVLGRRFTVGPVRGRDVQGVFIGVAARVLHDGLALAFEFGDQRGMSGSSARTDSSSSVASGSSSIIWTTGKFQGSDYDKAFVSAHSRCASSAQITG